jgi:Domain of unknown function (DUF4145)
MKPQLSGKTDYSVSARCSYCKAVTRFEPVSVLSVDSECYHEQKTYKRLVYVFCKCAGCGRGGLAVVPDNGNAATGVVASFFPLSIDAAPLPKSVPADIQNEFREAELCASFGANRAASALFRSALEKTLKANGYTKEQDSTLTDLKKRIDAAATDGVITAARQQKAHADIRTLGNDVLHDEWRHVTDDEVEDAHHYTQRILEDLYDDRPTVEGILKEKNRLPVSLPQAAAP